MKKRLKWVQEREREGERERLWRGFKLEEFQGV